MYVTFCYVASRLVKPFLNQIKRLYMKKGILLSFLIIHWFLQLTAQTTYNFEMQKPAGWSGAGLYSFNGTGYSPAGVKTWPGITLTQIGSTNYYYGTFTCSGSPAIIFNQSGASASSNQTTNITSPVNGGYYVYSSGSGSSQVFVTSTAPNTINNPSQTSLTFNTSVGSNSASQLVTISGSVLVAAGVTVTAPAYYQLSTDNSSWTASGGSLTYTPTNGTLANSNL